ncbi:MAG: cytochrome b N-terminal domain-containing protein [Actinomycetota bacterium]|nr:cytochrome b N-terminal domain-containing protein [Actinomycetota bacterium]
MITSQLVGSVTNMNESGYYLHWNVFTVSVANLVLIAVMVAIFGAALLVRFPNHRDEPVGSASGTGDGSPAPAAYLGDPADERMWTSRLRRRALSTLPPGKLLPDRQPAYVASWVYVFGVGALAALAMAVVSGFTIAIGGTDWWHTNPVGHFFNSLHLWSVELFMALMVIHLWGKFWMAAWRGRRALTWITGVIAFMASVLECFTGYLSQQNFDSQWIATNGKDSMNAAGVGGFFNLMNVGQMLLWHVVLLPIVLIALVGAHVLLVRMRGVSHPLPERRLRSRAERRAAAAEERAAWRGPTRRYDIVKEATAAVAIVAVLVIALAGFLSSPDEPPVTVQSWAQVAPADFIGTAASELAGTSETANYGPPYNHQSGSVQRLGISWQVLTGVLQPIDAASAFVLNPLSKIAPTDPPVAAALNSYQSAPAKQQDTWTTNYANALPKVSFVHGNPVLPAGDYGPVPEMLSTELTLARSGALDADLLAQHPFYGTNFTKPLLFLEDGSYYSNLAHDQHLTGSQWGVMNETGSYPGQPWLWLYTLWYQVRPFKNSTNVDLMAVYLTGGATILLLAVPFIPGVRDIPRVIPLYRLVWRDWYRRGGGGEDPHGLSLDGDANAPEQPPGDRPTGELGLRS